mmetsp:Transcript_99375/g.212893  ORF Transcript_99375/g.212893 Transcript_99375/m.212893 type:complete len:214 (-) Transcript_99375:301-942(-)
MFRHIVRALPLLAFTTQVSGLHNRRSDTLQKTERNSRAVVSNITNGQVVWSSTICVNGHCNMTQSKVSPDEFRPMQTLSDVLGAFWEHNGTSEVETVMSSMPEVTINEMAPLAAIMADVLIMGGLDGIFGSALGQTLNEPGLHVPSDPFASAITSSSSIEQSIDANGHAHYAVTTCNNGECTTTTGTGKAEQPSLRMRNKMHRWRPSDSFEPF